MSEPNIGHIAANMWEKKVAEHAGLFHTSHIDFFRTPYTPRILTARQKSASDRQFKRDTAALKRKNLKYRKQFIGRIVNVTGDEYEGVTLTFSDGRQLQAREVEWLPKMKAKR